jgi:hypothetical protein
MKPSAIACRIEYVWNGRLCPSAPTCPNVSSVFGFGVAVNAKNDRFFCLPRCRALASSASSAASTEASYAACSASSAASSASLLPRTEDLLQLGHRVPARGGVRLVDDDREPPPDHALRLALGGLLGQRARRPGTSAGS